MKVEGADFAAIFVTDFPRAAAFYRDTLGLEQSEEYGRIPGGEFETGNLTLQILDSAAIGREFTPNASPIALRVTDVEATRAELEAAGVEFLGPTIDSGVCHQAHFKDPDGNTLILHRRYAPK
jgi:predicted enzyme related to lactoylglutathione lyase